MVITGGVGQLRVGHQWAADIRQWSLTRRSDVLACTDSSVTGWVTAMDRYWIGQCPIRLGLQMGGSWWVWQVDSLSVNDIGTKISLTVSGNPEAVTEL